MRSALLLLAVCASCGNVSTPPPPPPAAMPWLSGFSSTAVVDAATSAAARRMADLLAVAAQDDYGGLELRADLAGGFGDETMLASYHLGLIVTDPAGHVVATAPGFETSGSADDLLALAIGDGQLGTPLILVAVQSGGHRENTVTLAIYRLGAGKTLERLFSAPIEEHEGTETRTGAVTFSPNGLAYRAPGARIPSAWKFDIRRNRYIEMAAALHE